jgi:hypothetical protein
MRRSDDFHPYTIEFTSRLLNGEHRALRALEGIVHSDLVVGPERGMIGVPSDADRDHSALDDDFRLPHEFLKTESRYQSSVDWGKRDYR